MPWFTEKGAGDIGEKQLCRWFQRCGLQAMRHEGAESFDITVQATVEVKHDLRAPATGRVAIDISTQRRSSLLNSPATYGALVVGDEAILVRSEVLRRAVLNGPWPICQTGDGRRRKVALLPVDELKGMEGAQTIQGGRPKTEGGIRSSALRAPLSAFDTSQIRDPTENGEKPMSLEHFIPQPLPEYGDDDNTPEAPGGRKLTVLVSLADVKPKPVRWLWAGKVAIGKLTLVAGEPAAGKSFVLADLAARVSRQGCWDEANRKSEVGNRNSDPAHLAAASDTSCQSPTSDFRPPASPAHVLLWNTHDELADTIRPRLDAGGADVSKITAVERTPAEGPEDRIGPPRALNECRDVENLEVAIDRTAGCRLVVIDTLPLRTSGRGLHREARRTLEALADLARRRNVAVVAVVDLPQAPTGAGWERSLKMLAAVPEVRAVWNILHDREQPGRRLMLPVKNNLVEGDSGLAFRLTAGRVEWESELVEPRAQGIGHRAHNGKAARLPSSDSRPWTLDFGPSTLAPQSAILFEAVLWLREALADGPMESKELLRLAGENGFSSATLRRVKQAAGVVSRREGFGPGAVWRWERVQGAEAKDEGGRMKDEPDKVCCNPKSEIRNPQLTLSAYGANGPKSKVQGPKSEDDAGNPKSEIRNRT